jgi:hypothetical protein
MENAEPVDGFMSPQESIEKPTLCEVAQALKDGKRKLEVDADYLAELLDYFEHNTNYTMQGLGDSKERLKRAEVRETELLLEIKKLTNKINELISNEPDPPVEPVGESKQLVGGFSIHIIPLSKVAAFLNRGVNRFADVYIKLDSKGNFIKFGTSEKELE